jgi:phospholipid/cholesterol/gamma-HCH transport system substrate-binding protein
MTISVEQKVGLFFLAALILLAVMIELVQDWQPFEDQFAYTAQFEAAVGLKVGDPVRIAGVDVGKVTAIGIDDSQVRVDFYINRDDALHRDSTAQIRQTNLLGGVFLGLDFGSKTAGLLPPGSTVRTTSTASIDQLITNIDRNQDRVLRPLGQLVEESLAPLTHTVSRLEKIVVKIDEGQGTLGLLVNDPTLYREVAAVSNRLNRVLGKLENGEGTLGRLASDPTLYDNLNRTVINLAELTDQINSGQGTLGRLVADDALYSDATKAVKSLNRITDRIDKGEGTLGKLLQDEQLYDELSSSAARINSIAGKIDEGHGTLGRLVNEDDLYRDAKTTLHKVEKSVDGINDTGPLSAVGVVLGTLF